MTTAREKELVSIIEELENENDMQRSIIDELIEKNKSLTIINDKLWQLFKQANKSNHMEVVR